MRLSPSYVLFNVGRRPPHLDLGLNQVGVVSLTSACMCRPMLAWVLLVHTNRPQDESTMQVFFQDYARYFLRQAKFAEA